MSVVGPKAEILTLSRCCRLTPQKLTSDLRIYAYIPDAALLRSSVALAAAVKRLGAIHLGFRGDDASADASEDGFDCARGRYRLVCGQPEGDGLRRAARHEPVACARRIAAAAAGAARIHRDGADCGDAVGDPRCRRSRRTALLHGQGRQSDITDP